MASLVHRTTVPALSRFTPGTRLLLLGLASSVFWVVANEAVAAPLYQGYSRLSQTISELSALDAPSRPVLVPMLALYEAMVLVFGGGVWRAARGKRSLRIAGGLLIAGGALGLASLAFPLTQRLSALKPGAALPLSDVVHNITYGGIGPLLMLATMGFGAAGLGRRFRVYTIVSAVTLLAGGVMTIATGPASGWMGAFERLDAWAWMLWVAVFSMALRSRFSERTTDQ